MTRAADQGAQPHQRDSSGRPWRIAAALLAALQAALLAHTAWDKSDTADEPYYLASAVEQWNRRNFADMCDAPPLPRWGFAAALRLADPPLFDPAARIGRHPLWSRPMAQSRRNLLSGRAVSLLVTVGAGLLLRASALRFGPAAALVTHALWCFSPTVLAHGALATLDGWVSAALCAALWLTVRFLEAPTLRRAAALGAGLGLAAACKATALGAVPVALGAGAWAIARRSRAQGGAPPWKPLAQAALVAGAAFVLALWSAYAFETGALDPTGVCGRPSGSGEAALGPLPFPSWFAGLLLQTVHGSTGHRSYLFGEISAEGWWWFYLACLALKTTLGAQLLAVVAAAGRIRRRAAAGGWLADAAILAYPLILITAMSLGKAQNGIRYVLPAFPFLMLWAGRGAAHAGRAFGRRGWAAVALALAAGTAESLAVHPHHLMFFNAWAGGPQGGPRYLVHGDDWGQDQRRLAAWIAEHRPWRLYYTYYSGNPLHWGISYETPPCEPRPGLYALHAVEVHRPKRIAPGCLDWLTVEPPDERLGHSIYLYQVNRERIGRLQAARDTRQPFWRSALR